MPPVSRRAEAKRIGETKQSELVRLPSRDVVLQWRPTEEEVAIAKSVLENTYSGSDEPFSRSRQAELVLGFHEVNLSISALANGIAVTPAPAAVERPKAAETKPLQAPSRQLLSGYIPSEAHFNGANEVLRSGTVRLSVARQARVVRTLYKDPTTPLGEIADEEGVSYERIRQICVDLKQNGFEVKQSQLS